MAPLVPIDDSLDVQASSAPVRPAAAPRPSVLPESTSARARRRGLELSVPQLPSLRALGIVFVALALGVVGWRHGPRELDEAPGDRAAVVGAPAVAALAGFELDPAHERFEVRQRLFGGVTLDYAYEPPTRSRGPRIATTAKTHPSEEAARDEYRLQAVRLVLDWNLDGEVGLVPLDEGDPWAEQSAAFRVEREGETLGYSVTLREDVRTLYTRLEGDELAPSDVRSLCVDALSALSAREEK